MPSSYVVQAGDCISSIAEVHGFFWQTLWDHPDNASLRESRLTPNTLVAGDVVHIPDLRQKIEKRPTGARHKFKKKGVPAKLRVQLFEANEKRANQEFVIDVDGKIQKGKTDADGFLEVSISPTARLATITVGADADPIELELGHLEPVTTTLGVQARLDNLGFACPQTGELDDATANALRGFQRRNGLAESGLPDDDTRKQLAKLHDDVSDMVEDAKGSDGDWKPTEADDES